MRGPSALVYLERPGEAQRVFVREQTNPFTVGARGWIIMVLFYAINRFSFSFFFFLSCFSLYPFFLLPQALTHFLLRVICFCVYLCYIAACVSVYIHVCICLCADCWSFFFEFDFFGGCVACICVFLVFWFFLCLFCLLCLFLFLHNAIYICTVFCFFSYFFLFEISFSVLIFIHAFMRGFFSFLMHVCFLIFFHFVILCICLVRGGGPGRQHTHWIGIYLYWRWVGLCGRRRMDGRTDGRARDAGRRGRRRESAFLWL